MLPLNTKLVKEPARGGEGVRWYLVSRTPVVTGRDLRNARSSQDEFRKWETGFSLSPDGARRFERFTEANIGNRLAVVLDNQIRSVATIQARISDQGRITNVGTEQEASDLALVLRSGSLPAGIVYIEERSVGPSLGADSSPSRWRGTLPGTASAWTESPLGRPPLFESSTSVPTGSVRQVTCPANLCSVRYRTLCSTKPRRTASVA